MQRDDILFADRRDAGRRLAKLLASRTPPDLVLALPRGGVPVAWEVAQALNVPLDVLIVRKIGAPGHEEYGIGAIVDGNPPHTVLNEEAMAMVAPTPTYLENETQRQLKEIERRRRAYRGDRPPLEVEGRSVVVIDDGIATGGTARAALEGLKKAGVGRLTFAVPVAPPDAIAVLEAIADEVICLATPHHFRAVGLHYADFSQTSDAEVVALLGTGGSRA